jgi:probable rRNA maturation factor
LKAHSQGIVNFHLQSKKYKLSNRKSITSWINLCADNEQFVVGEINIIYCTSAKLLKINKIHLNHDFHTDIITFDYTVGNIISGDLYISYDMVKENAKKFGVHFNDELLRVIIHGTLHLMNYKDKSPATKKEMKAKEDQYLSLFHKEFHVKH